MHKLKNHSIEKPLLYRPVECCRYRCLSWACSRLFVEEIAEIRVCFVQNNIEVSELQQHSQPAFHSTYGHRTWTSMRALPARERTSHFWSSGAISLLRRPAARRCTWHTGDRILLIAHYTRIAITPLLQITPVLQPRIANTPVLQITPVLQPYCKLRPYDYRVDDPTPAPWVGLKRNVPAAPAALRRRTLLRVRGDGVPPVSVIGQRSGPRAGHLDDTMTGPPGCGQCATGDPPWRALEVRVFVEGTLTAAGHG